LEIYLIGARMFMIMEVNQNFSFEKKAEADAQDPKVQSLGATHVEIPASVARKQNQAKNGYAWNVFLKLEP